MRKNVRNLLLQGLAAADRPREVTDGGRARCPENDAQGAAPAAPYTATP